ncbi:hypothetical protein SAMN05444280_1754 [Tangfeifania diversioriginum]|uniref:Uncharacterized protein n=1 Tax=Tangfeifania diversioriginum TaxID=1168035 RepID=A0A1M6PV50_9BACT|nr:hypothetical protein [Tangfeifania diversioriginum]SHK11863.1 hypothetical protein SAMN05444280_1754 [Tangfeifania diversioriginum]
MKNYKGDPRLINARFKSSCCNCEAEIRKGESAYYWPHGKMIFCLVCGEPEFREFVSMAADENAYNGSGNPY